MAQHAVLSGVHHDHTERGQGGLELCAEEMKHLLQCSKWVLVELVGEALHHPRGLLQEHPRGVGGVGLRPRELGQALGEPGAHVAQEHIGV